MITSMNLFSNIKPGGVVLDFTPVRNNQTTLTDLADNLSRDDLIELTNEMIDAQLRLIADCTDADVVFVPDDPVAHDPFAEDPEDVTLAWTLGHVIVHVTASSEEAASISAELARGVKYHGRSRYETPWQTIKTIKDCRQRLEESRRMRLASLEMWPEQPHLKNEYKSRPGAPPMNTITRFIYGLMHDDDHILHLAEIVEQAKKARTRPKD
jgi:hypothetical protein